MLVWNYMTKVRKAVIAAAGFGTRFLPQTKAMPKEMLPLIDKPVIQYVVEELVRAGIEDIIIVTGYHKRSIEDHFDNVSADLRQNLIDGNKQELLKRTEAVANLANFAYIRQKGPYGNATPVLNAEHLIGDEPFIYTFADDFMVGSPSRTQQLISQYEQSGSPVLACLRAQKDEDYDRYGFVAGEEEKPGLIRMNTIIEKPGKVAAPSDLASVSGYLLTPDIFPAIKSVADTLAPGIELQLQPAMQLLIDEGKVLYALEVTDNIYYDTGNKLEYLKTMVDFALQDETLASDFRDFLQTRLS